MKRKSIQSTARFSLGVMSMGILVACGGGGGGSSLGIADGGIRGTGSSVGPVSGFGSVIVNGVRFDTSEIPNRTVQSNDGISTEGELDEGMILRVDGEWRENGEGTASEVEYDDTLRGPITVESAWDPVTESAVIAIQGLRVNIDGQTVIKGVALPENLGTGDVVRVSGWRLANGEFRASLVRVGAGTGDVFGAGNEIEVEGEITWASDSACSFEIDTVRVDCNALDPQIEPPLTSADLVEGKFVEVEGDLEQGTGNLLAREIRQDDQRRYARGTEDDIEFSGPVTEDFDGNDRFVINGITVIITDETEFDDGLEPKDLLEGLLIQVEGDYQPDGITVVADEIELREADAQIQGVIGEGLDGDIFTVGGVQIRITANTLIESDDDDASFNINKDELLSQLVAGLEVEVEGIERDNGNELEAVKIEIDVEEDGGEDGEALSFELEGKLRAIDENSITILGVAMGAEQNAFDDVTRTQLEELLNTDENRFPILEVEYDKRTANGFSYQAEDIELKEDDG
jgi:hypothetical protein